MGNRFMSKTPVRDKSRKDQDELPKAEADRRRDELARRILRTPPQPREESKIGKHETPKKNNQNKRPQG